MANLLKDHGRGGEVSNGFANASEGSTPEGPGEVFAVSLNCTPEGPGKRRGYHSTASLGTGRGGFSCRVSLASRLLCLFPIPPGKGYSAVDW